MSRKKSKGLGAAGGTFLTRAGDRTEGTQTQAEDRPSASIVSTLQQGPGEGDGRARELPLELVAPHPQNRRPDDLDGLASSIESVGVLQPIVVVPVATFRAHWEGSPADVPSSTEWVVYAGHRRHAASKQAGKTTIPAIVREDLNEPAAAPTTRLVENIHRKDLTPLEEARDFALLSDLGHGQSEIAKMCGFSQPHVSKRIRLLGLPQRVQDAVAIGAITLGEADKLTQLSDIDEQIQVFDRSQRTGTPIASLIAELERTRREGERVEVARTQAVEEGIELVAARTRFGTAASTHRLNGDAEVEAARTSGTLVAEPTPYGLRYYTTQKPTHSAPTNATAAQPEPSTSAPAGEPGTPADNAKVRLDACGQLVLKSRPKRKTGVVDLVNATLLRYAHLVDLGEARNLAYEWLSTTIGNPRTAATVDSWLNSLDEAETAWAAYGTCIAVCELATQDDPTSGIAREHLQRLATVAGYEPTTAEADHIADIAEYSAGISEGSHV